MSEKTFVYSRYDLPEICSGADEMVPSNDGPWVSHDEAINREAVLQAKIRTLEVQLKDIRAPKAVNRLCHTWIGNKCRYCGIVYESN